MEALWQNLQEQEIKLQQQQDLRSYDLTNMENIKHGEPPPPPQRKYVSIFRIGGEPILPPLVSINMSNVFICTCVGKNRRCSQAYRRLYFCILYLTHPAMGRV